MNNGKGVRKIPDGKLVKIELDFDKKIESIKITGDFFCYPENIISDIESLLKNKILPLHIDKTILEIEEILTKGDLIGVSARDIVEVAVEATKCNGD